MGMGQLNIRVPDELRAGLREAARRRGVSQAILARHALEHVARSEPDLLGPPPSLPTASDEAHAALVDMVAERTGLPRAVVRRKLERGGVQVDERDAREVVYVPSEGAPVTVDGQPV